MFTDTYSISPTNSVLSADFSHRKSFLADNDYSSSLGSEQDTLHTTARSPPPPVSFSPRYSSPPAGSGGKYMFIMNHYQPHPPCNPQQSNP
ncbi:hypothetical protein G6F68_014554 [Rhizopus microsporus]|nr:hypothetical protein G6F68_014554 [Rhizopus microsporus]